MRAERTRIIVVDLVLWALLSCPVLLKGDPDDGGSWAGVAFGVAALAVAVLVWRRAPLASLSLVTALSAVENLELVTVQYSLAMAVFGGLLGWRSPRARPALLAFGGITAAGLVLVLAVEANLWTWPAQLSSLLFTVVVPWLVGRYIRQYAELVRTGWELADRMEREQRAVADRARIRERSRIAGDMHDSLGHDLSLIAVRAAALEVDRTLSERQRASAGELRQSAADATARLRDIVGVLRADDERAPTVPADEPVGALVERARQSGLRVELREERRPGALPPMTDRAVYRVVQEALTNAAKHAPGAAVVVTVAEGPESVGEPESVVVAVGNGPATGPPSGLVGGGSGLVGLDERVRLAGGELAHGPRPDGGFALTARLPATGTTATGTTAGTAAAGEPPLPGPGSPATASARELRRARMRVRRGLRQVIVVPAVAVAVLGVVLFFVDQYIRSQSVLDRESYERIRIGDARSEVAPLLPEYSLEQRPPGVDPEPAGAGDCVYYAMRTYDWSQVYRLCFRDGRLASKTVVVDVANEEDRQGVSSP
ncbi:sensor histidine kinase [Streptomyces katsurahamanus]|uniref:histidine kinase n=1 Tax=Streptomyces katsurahamanus TaxID=2577098 RepID=A0ABW9NWH2_9ACTN|nr:histidine kinase [Streptomyces katsurahamanus]MQS37680.1 sensor histidine kinase [Streptomyces katsurahamanus]